MYVWALVSEKTAPTRRSIICTIWYVTKKQKKGARYVATRDYFISLRRVVRRQALRQFGVKFISFYIRKENLSSIKKDTTWI